MDVQMAECYWDVFMADEVALIYTIFSPYCQ